jgi:transaldolase
MKATRLFALVDRPNIMIKVPATAEGVAAFQELIEAGININVTLMFSLEQYDQIAEAYISALEKAGRERIQPSADRFSSLHLRQPPGYKFG